MFLIKQVSSDLGITPQAIYKQKEELQNKGYMIKNSSNDWEITSDGYNYLKEKQINRFKRNNISLKENDIKSTNLQGKEENNSLNETLINFYETRLEEIKQSYENQLNEQKKQVEYFNHHKSLFGPVGRPVPDRHQSRAGTWDADRRASPQLLPADLGAARPDHRGAAHPAPDRTPGFPLP